MLITGARSKLALPLIKYFISNGDNVALVSKNKLNIINKDVKTYIIDLSKGLQIDYKPDLIVHMAAYVPYNFIKKKTYDQVYIKNIIPCLKVLEFAVKNKVKNFILISSIDVYGKSIKDKIDETDLCKPQNVYGLAKLACEKISYTFSHIYNLNVSILRFGPIVGPSMSKNLKIYKMVNDFIKGKKIKIDYPNSLVSFLSEDMASEAIIKASKKKFRFSIFNVTGNSLKIIKLFQCFLNENNKKNIIIGKENRINDHIIFSNQKAKTKLGWVPDSNFKNIANSFLKLNKIR